MIFFEQLFRCMALERFKIKGYNNKADKNLILTIKKMIEFGGK